MVASKFRIVLESVEGSKTVGRSSSGYAIRVKEQDYATCPDPSRPYPSRCTVSFPFSGPNIGAHQNFLLDLLMGASHELG